MLLTERGDMSVNSQRKRAIDEIGNPEMIQEIGNHEMILETETIPEKGTNAHVIEIVIKVGTDIPVMTLIMIVKRNKKIRQTEFWQICVAKRRSRWRKAGRVIGSGNLSIKTVIIGTPENLMSPTCHPTIVWKLSRPESWLVSLCPCPGST
jgi:hypothetical protein